MTLEEDGITMIYFKYLRSVFEVCLLSLTLNELC